MQAKWLKLLSSVSLSVAMYGAAFAQDQIAGLDDEATAQTDERDRSSGEKLLQTVYVTSQKKSVAEDAQTVPIAITAYSPTQLDALGVEDLTDLSLSAPNVQLTPIGTVAGVANFNIRGSGVVNSIPSVDPAVGVVVDGVPLGTIYGAVIDTFDLESLEVLRGPQGTLFGRNVTGGVANLRSARPTDEFSGKIRAIVGSDDRTDFAIALGGPMSDQWGARVSVQYQDRGGWIENAAVGRDQGASNSVLVRPTITYDNGGGFDITAIGEIFRGTNDDTPVWGPNASPDFSFITLNSSINDNEQEWEAITLEANLDLGPGVLTGVFGYRDLLVNSAAELGAGTIPGFLFLNDLAQDQTSLEVRWAGELTDRLSLTTGVFFFDQFYDYDEERFIQLPTSNIHFIRGGNIDQRAVGVFAQADFALTDSLNLTVGGRYSDEEKDAELFIVGDGSCDPVAAFDPAIVPPEPSFFVRGNPDSCSAPIQSNSWSDFSPKIALNYTVNENILLYGSWSEGFRSGGFNLRHPDPTSSAAYEPEKLTAYELGFKSDLFDNKLRLNGAIFRNETTDFQATSNSTNAAGDIIQVVANDAEIEVEGIELEAIWLLT